MNLNIENLNGGSSIPIPNRLGRQTTNPQALNFNRFFDLFYLIGHDINNDGRFIFKDKRDKYIIEYNYYGEYLFDRYGRFLPSYVDHHLTLHEDIGLNDRFHLQSEDKTRKVQLLFYIKLDSIDGRYKLKIDRSDNSRLSHNENVLLDMIQDSFNNNYRLQMFLSEEYELTQNEVLRIEREEMLESLERKRIEDRERREIEIDREREEKESENRPVEVGRKRASDRSYKEKYIKYKFKYLKLKKKLESQNL